MAAAGLTVGGLLVFAMIGVSVRGWLTLPSDDRVPVHHGLRGYGRYLSKTAGLVTWPPAGIVIYGLTSVSSPRTWPRITGGRERLSFSCPPCWLSSSPCK